MGEMGLWCFRWQFLDLDLAELDHRRRTGLLQGDVATGVVFPTYKLPVLLGSRCVLLIRASYPTARQTKIVHPNAVSSSLVE